MIVMGGESTNSAGDIISTCEIENDFDVRRGDMWHVTNRYYYWYLLNVMTEEAGKLQDSDALERGEFLGVLGSNIQNRVNSESAADYVSLYNPSRKLLRFRKFHIHHILCRDRSQTFPRGLPWPNELTIGSLTRRGIASGMKIGYFPVCLDSQYVYCRCAVQVTR